MASTAGKATLVTTKVVINPKSRTRFLSWQARLNKTIAKFPGFISLEFLSPTDPSQHEWVIVQHFVDAKSSSGWRHSKECAHLMEELKDFLKDEKTAPHHTESDAEDVKGNVTEVFITQVSADQEAAYSNWMEKIHQAESKFPGFKSLYIQSPHTNKGKHWITLLQFDTPEHLDHWLNSPERKKILQESQPFIGSIETHRMISPYGGWFASLGSNATMIPVWKQTMLVLLVLYPIVMLELKFLSPLTAGLHLSIATFIGNALSVSLISWPMMPLAIVGLSWWLTPKASSASKTTWIGILVIILLYLIEVILFWKVL